jgi:non-ribosomal peptide synthetase component F
METGEGKQETESALEPEALRELPPRPTAEEMAELYRQSLRQMRLAEIDEALAATDIKKVRPLAAIALAQEAGDPPADADMARLAELEAQAQALREERAALIAG